jgi:hypothetical protein
MHFGFVELRVILGMGAEDPGWLVHHRELFDQGCELANLLHNMPASILDPEFGECDINFINIAIPVYLERAGEPPNRELLSLLIAFHDAVPSGSLRDRITWHPTKELRRWVEMPATDRDN